MKRDVDGLPIVGSNSKELGVRVPPNPHADVDVKPDGTVELNGKGMSVAKHWTLLRSHLIPTRLSHIRPGAGGPDSLACYRIGEGTFSVGPLNDDLELCLKPGQTESGNIVPSRVMPIGEFQRALGATRGEWAVEETAP